MTDIVIATRTGLAQAPDGSKYRIVRGRTLADARHPLAAAHPDLFAPYAIELSVDDPEAADPGHLEDAVAEELAEAKAAAEGYREQLAAIAEGLHARGLVPADLDTGREGWLADLVLELADDHFVKPEPAAADGITTTAPGALPKPRKRAARPKPAAVDE